MALKDQIQERLEYLRGEIRAERISYSELAELQSYAENIEPGDVELLEWAGVPEATKAPHVNPWKDSDLGFWTDGEYGRGGGEFVTAEQVWEDGFEASTKFQQAIDEGEAEGEYVGEHTEDISYKFDEPGGELDKEAKV